jgi:predicted transcriptional regulator
MYIDVLKVLASDGPLTLANIMSKANFNCNVPKEHMSLLIKYQLVEERTTKKRKTVFEVTQKGIRVLRYFREFEQVPPIME